MHIRKFERIQVHDFYSFTLHDNIITTLEKTTASYPALSHTSCPLYCNFNGLAISIALIFTHSVLIHELKIER